MSFSSMVRHEGPPKCRCGVGEMKLFTSRTHENPNRKFWKCPNWNNERDCRAFRWKDSHYSNSLYSEGNSATTDNEDRPEERKVSIVGIEQLQTALRVSIESGKIGNMYLRKIFHAIVLMCCIILVILVLMFKQT